MSGDPFLEALADALEPIERAYELNAVPPKPKYPYLAYSLTIERPDGYTLDASHGFRWCRITWQSFGRSLTSVRDIDNAATDLLLDHSLDVPGWECDPTGPTGALLGALVRDSADDGILQITSTLTFTATKERP